MTRNWRIGIDLGGTKIEGLCLDPAGAEIARQRMPTPRGDYAATLAAIAALVGRLERAAGAPCRVGIGMPGAISPKTGRVKNANSTWLNGQPFREDLAAALARPVRVENDANCFAVSEARDGAAAGLEVVFGVILGTGVGGGIALHGRALTGRNAIAGEWGHTPLPWPEPDETPGEPCYCGRRGCIETWLSGPGLAADHARVTGHALAGEAIVAAAAAGDGPAADTLARHAARLAKALAVVVDILDPDAIVLGGGLSRLAHLYESVPARLPGWCFSDGIETPILAPRFGDSSGVRGAAMLWDGE